MNISLKNILSSPYTILLLIVLAANWQLVILQSCMEWDMMNFWMPWRYYMSECYNNGIVPLWDPYAQSGYPVHGDLQGPAYSPEAILVSFLFGQNIYVLNYCFVFYLYVAAVGMYKLTCFFTGKKDVSVLAGATYALCGFNVAHGHYFYIIISVALIPLIFYYFFRILNNGNYTDALKFSLIIFWHITSGNPSFLIISGYLMAIIFVFYSVWKIRNKQISEWRPVIGKLALVAGLSVLMALPVIYNAMQIIPLTTRKDGLDLAYAGDESFYFQNFIAFLIPLITITNKDLTGYEQELWSPYIGAFIILFFLIGIFRKKNFFEWMLLLVGTAGLLIALGLQAPVYPFLHKYLPFFNIFRMPNLSLLFFLVAAIILGAKYISDEERVKWLFAKRIPLIFAAVWLLCILFMYYFAQHHNPVQGGLFDHYTNLRQWIYDAQPAQICLLHLILFAATFLLLLVLNFSPLRKMQVLSMVILFDVFVNYQFGGTARIFSPEKAPEMNSYFRRFPKNFPVPAPMAMERVSALNTGWPGYWLNTSIFNKQPDFPNSNNFELTNYLDLLLKKPQLAKNIFKNSYAFFADSLVAEETFVDSLLSSTKNVIPLNKNDLAQIRQGNFVNDSNKLTCTSFLPNKNSFEIKNSSPAVFVIAQNYCPLWKFTVNGQPFTPYRAASNSFPAFALQAGTWKIESVYTLPGFDALLLFSLALFVVILIIVLRRSALSSPVKNTGSALVIVLFGYCFIKFQIADAAKSKEQVSKQFERLAAEHKSMLVNNTTIPLSGFEQVNLLCNEDVARLCNLLDSTRRNEITLLNYDRAFTREAEEMIEAVYGKKTREELLADGASCLIFQRDASKNLVLDTMLNTESVVGQQNAYSAGILLDSTWAPRLKPGDLVLVTAEISAPCFDFPGLALEASFRSKNQEAQNIYRYANISTTKGARRQRVLLLFRLPAGDAGMHKILTYVWNPSVCTATVRQLKMRIYRP